MSNNNIINYKNKKARELFLEALRIDKIIEEKKEEEEKDEKNNKDEMSKMKNTKKIKDLEYESDLRKTLAAAIEQGVISEDEAEI